MDADVIIVGAGASGLMAACTLAETGKKVLILEARDRIGGRIYPLPASEFGYEAMGGAEFLHGDAPVSEKLLAEAGVTLEHSVEWWDVRDGEAKIVEHGSHVDKVSPHDAALEAKLRELTEDMPVAEFLDKHFFGDEHAAVRQSVRQRVEEYDAADPARASSFALLEELTDQNGWKQRTLKEGYGVMLRYLEGKCTEAGVQIRLNTSVISIDFSGETVRIACADGSAYECAKAVVTVPLPLIQTIYYTPALPEKLKAAEEIGFGPVIKIPLRFKRKWWASPEREANFERMFFMFSHEAIPTWWTQYPEPHLVLTGWVAGPGAAALSSESDEHLLDLALISLSNIFKISIEELKSELVASKVINWPSDPCSLGGYSYSTPESEAAIEELLQPVNNKLYFAGEAIGEGDTGGTVEAALASGQAVARNILTT